MDKGRILIAMVDDDAAILRAGVNALSPVYSLATFSSADRLFDFLRQSLPALILLDVMMPGMDGYQTIRTLKADERTRGIPVIFLSGMTGADEEFEGLNLGAVDYIAKPFVPLLLRKRIEMHLLMESQRLALEDFNANLQSMVERKTRTVMVLQNAIIQTIADLVERWDNMTGSHSDRAMRGVGILIGALGQAGLYEDQIASWNMDLLLPSSQLHDVGKIAVSDQILKKPGPLLKAEFEEMKKHTTYGVQVIEKIKTQTQESEFLDYARVFVEAHHERWDGTGYPHGLAGERIPLLGRIMALADVYDALISARPYKKALSREEAVRIIRAGRGTQFDPRLTDIFITMADRFPEPALLAG